METTLLIVIKDNKILLGEKKRGFSVGKIIGTGGKVEPNESVENAMIRETQEEIGITPTIYQKRAYIEFDTYYKGNHELLKMHVFIATEYDGDLTESNEMKPIWFDINNIPYDRMLADDKLWLTEVLKNNNVRAKFKFDRNFNLLSKEMHVTENRGTFED